MKKLILTFILLTLTGCMSIQEINKNLLHSSEIGDSVQVKDMLDRGGDINFKNLYGDTPLHLAIKYKHPEIVELLINKGAKINIAGELDDTPLHTSIYTNQKETTLLLLNHGADINILNRYGLNPFEMEELPKIDNYVTNTAKLLNSNGVWMDRNKGRENYDILQGYPAKQVINSLVLQVIKKDAYRLRILLLSIKLGIKNSEEKLANLLMVYGYKAMAEDYLNSGSDILESAAGAWASAHGYQIFTGPGSNRAGWGKF